MWVYDNNTNELYHYGRKGMKWGQHIFGKVKTASSNARAKIAEKRTAKKAAKAAEALRKKPISKLTDAELKARTERMKKEKELFDLERSVSSINADKISAGKKFIAKFGNEAVTPAIIGVGKTLITNALKKRFGIDAEDTSNSLDLLKKGIENLNDSEIKKLAKRAEDSDNIAKKLLGKKDKSGDDDDDGTNSDKSDTPLDEKTDAQINKQKKRRENIDYIKKSQTKDSESESKPKPKTYEVTSNTKVSDLPEEDIEKGYEWLNSLGDI